MNETTATVEKKSKKKKRLLTTVAKRAGSAGAAQKTALAKMEAIVSGLVALSDSELKSLQKVVDKQIQYRAAQQRIFKSIYKKA
jgi:hypothetical protein